MEFFTEKKIAHKIIIAVVFVLLFNFISPTISSASIGGVLFEPIKDLLLVIADGIMMLSQKFIFDLDVSFLTIYHRDSGWKTAAQIGGAILGVAAVVGLTILTGGAFSLVAALAVGAGGAYVCGKIAAESIPPTFRLPIFLLTPENMFNNSVPFLDVNFFETADDKGAQEMDIDGDGNMDGYYIETTTTTGEIVYQKSSALVLKPTISKWYYALRNFAIVALLCILVYTAIRIIISSTAEDKAKYKQRSVDWLVAMCLLFFMHYFMAFAVSLTESITDAINSANKPYIINLGSSSDKLNEYKYGNGSDESSEGSTIFGHDTIQDTFRKNGVIVTDSDTGDEVFMWSTNLMGKARMELQLEPTDLTEDDIEMRQFGYTVIYLVLVIYTMLFLFRYLKRLLMLTFLTIIAPLMAMTYPLDKMRDGSAQGFNMLMKEYLYNLLIQPVHLILYTVLIGSAMDLIQDNVLFAIVALGFILQAENLLRKFFGFDKATTVSGGSALGGALAMQGLNMATKALGNFKKSGNGGKGGKDGKGGKGNNSLGAGNNNELTRGKDSDKNSEDLYTGGDEPLEDATGAGDTAGSGGEMGIGKYWAEKTALGKTITAPIKSTTRKLKAFGKGISIGFHQFGKGIHDLPSNVLDRMPISDDAKAAWRTTGRNFAKHAKRLGKGVKYVAPKAARFAAQTAVKGTLAGTGAMLGMTAGLVSDDFSNVAKWGAAGLTGGLVAGGGAIGAVTGLDSKLKETHDEMYEATHTEEEVQERQNVKADKKWEKDSKTIERYMEAFECDREEAKEKMKIAKAYRRYGVTDDGLIIKAMKAKSNMTGFSFGAENGKDRILLAQLASQATKPEDVDQIEKGLRRRFNKDRDHYSNPNNAARAYAEAIRKMKNYV